MCFIYNQVLSRPAIIRYNVMDGQVVEQKAGQTAPVDRAQK